MIGYHNECGRQSRDALGKAQFHSAFRRGSRLSLEEAVEYAVQRPPPSAAPSPPPVVTLLTRRERQVAGLVSRGLSNREIARTLVISPRTAEGHVENILAKLGFTSRSQVSAWFAAQAEGNDTGAEAAVDAPGLREQDALS